VKLLSEFKEALNDMKFMDFKPKIDGGSKEEVILAIL
jgi:hypothetical protein